MTPEECVKGIARAVGQVGGEWMFDATVSAKGAELGLDSWAWYHVGRGGVLGDADPAALVAAFGFFNPAVQVKAWGKGLAVLEPRKAAELYAAECAAFGLRRFGEVADAARLADLLTRALDSAVVMALPLFAGWRTLLHRYDGASGPERLALALQTAREHRGGSHLVAVAGYGVPPLQALVSGRNGPPNAQFFGWPEPYPDPEAGREKMAAAERITNLMVAAAFEVLTPAERTELAAGLRAL
jgi:hypothetical protein